MSSTADKEKFRDALINNKRAYINGDDYRIETIKNTGIYYGSKINISYYYRVYRNDDIEFCTTLKRQLTDCLQYNDIIDIYIS